MYQKRPNIKPKEPYTCVKSAGQAADSLKSTLYSDFVWKIYLGTEF